MPKMEKEIRFDVTQFDSKGQLKPDALLTAFQDIASDHVDHYHVGMEDLIKINLLWVVIQTKYVVKEKVLPDQKYIIATWSLKPRHGMVQREYSLCDETGKHLIIGVSRWVLMDLNTRKATLKMEEVLANFKQHDVSNFEKRQRLLKPFPQTDNGHVVVPDESAIDFNDHVNNSCYAAYATDLLQPDSGRISEFTIDYHKEMRLGETLVLYQQADAEAGTVDVEGFSEVGDELVFVCNMKME